MSSVSGTAGMIAFFACRDEENMLPYAAHVTPIEVISCMRKNILEPKIGRCTPRKFNMKPDPKGEEMIFS